MSTRSRGHRGNRGGNRASNDSSSRRKIEEERSPAVERARFVHSRGFAYVENVEAWIYFNVCSENGRINIRSLEMGGRTLGEMIGRRRIDYELKKGGPFRIVRVKGSGRVLPVHYSIGLFIDFKEFGLYGVASAFACDKSSGSWVTQNDIEAMEGAKTRGSAGRPCTFEAFESESVEKGAAIEEVAYCNPVFGPGPKTVKEGKDSRRGGRGRGSSQGSSTSTNPPAVETPVKSVDTRVVATGSEAEVNGTTLNLLTEADKSTAWGDIMNKVVEESEAITIQEEKRVVEIVENQEVKNDEVKFLDGKWFQGETELGCSEMAPSTAKLVSKLMANAETNNIEGLSPIGERDGKLYDLTGVTLSGVGLVVGDYAVFRVN